MKSMPSLVYGIVFITSGCNVQELQNAIQEASNASTTTSSTSTTPTSSDGSCTYTVSAVYLVGVNPYLDFVVHSPRVNEAVIESNCDGVSEGETKSIHAESVSRHSDQVQILDDLNLEALSANASLLTEANHSDCEGTYRVTREFLGGSIDTFNETLKVQMKISYENDGSCTSPGTSPANGTGTSATSASQAARPGW